MTGQILYKKNGAYLRVLDVTNSKTDVKISDATVTATLRTWSARGGLGTSAACSEISNLALSPMEGTDGGYEGVVAATFNPEAGTGYRCEIDVVKTGIEPAHFEIPIEIKVRTS